MSPADVYSVAADLAQKYVALRVLRESTMISDIVGEVSREYGVAIRWAEDVVWGTREICFTVGKGYCSATSKIMPHERGTCTLEAYLKRALCRAAEYVVSQ